MDPKMYSWILIVSALLELVLVIAIIGSFLTLIKMKKQNDDILYQIKRIAVGTGGENETGWKCPNCNKINPNFVGTCSCGTSKP